MERRSILLFSCRRSRAREGSGLGTPLRQAKQPCPLKVFKSDLSASLVNSCMYGKSDVPRSRHNYIYS
jgi:hypothetical protein